MDFGHICFEVQELVEHVGDYIRHERKRMLRQNAIEEKGKSDLVTSLDKKSEELLVEGLSDLLPEAGFIVEEGTSDKKGETYNWIIDPIDGTTNFIHGLTPYSISVALMDKDEIVIGVVFEISHQEMFYAWQGSPAFRNGKLIDVSLTETHDKALIGTGLPYCSFDKLEANMKALDFFMKNSRGVRRLGSAAIDLCYVAAGIFDGFWELGLKPWDVAAGVLIVERAGGCIADFKGGSDYLFGGEMVASNKNYKEDFQKVITEYLG